MPYCELMISGSTQDPMFNAGKCHMLWRMRAIKLMPYCNSQQEQYLCQN